MRYDPDRDKELRALRQRIEQLEAENEALRGRKRHERDRPAFKGSPQAMLAYHYNIGLTAGAVLYALANGQKWSIDQLRTLSGSKGTDQVIRLYISQIRWEAKKLGSSIVIMNPYRRCYQIRQGLDELQQVMNGAPLRFARLDCVDDEMLR